MKLNIIKQQELFQAFNMLDAQERVVTVNDNKVVERIPYVLGGSARRAIVKNILLLKQSLESFEEVKLSVLKSFWKEAPEGEIKVSEFPEGIFEKWKTSVEEAASQEDEINLIPLTEEQLGDNDFPISALMVLTKNGLIN